MRRLFVIPLVGVMLAALAVPVLAEGNTGTLTIPTESQNIEVQGRYDDTTGAITTFSVDIKWGNMKAMMPPTGFIKRLGSRNWKCFRLCGTPGTPARSM